MCVLMQSWTDGGAEGMSRVHPQKGAFIFLLFSLFPFALVMAQFFR